MIINSSLLQAAHLNPDLISVVHRLPSVHGPPSAMSNKPPPVVMKLVRRQTKLVRRQTKHALIVNRKFLKGKQVVITEHLTTTRSDLLRKATALVTTNKLQSAWSQEGRILVRSTHNRTVQLSLENDLHQFN